MKNKTNTNDAPSIPLARDGVTVTEPLPEKQKGRVDYEILKNGYKHERILEVDTLFFRELVLSMCGP